MDVRCARGDRKRAFISQTKWQERGEMTSSELFARCKALGPREAAELVGAEDPDVAVAALIELLPSQARTILRQLGEVERGRVLAAAPPERVLHWAADTQYPENSIGRVMEPPIGVFRPEETVGEVIEQLRDLVKTFFVTYGFIVDPAGKLVGVITMRDLLFSERDRRLEDIMLKGVFALEVTTPLIDAMKQTLDRHYPVYPVCDGEGVLMGLVRGQQMFEQQAVELSAQAGSMVGVTKEERLATPWGRSLLFRHPWLQLNLLTAFLAAGVVSVFEGTIEQITVLAVFLPVLAGQSGNTGCQALAVTLRGMTLGELVEGKGGPAIFKEALLGLLNGALVGVTAGIGMYLFVAFGSGEGQEHSAAMLGIVVFLAMIGSCVISGVAGVLVPLALRRFGADPATASSIFLTTATDVVSMGTFLGLATWLVL
jgi:magnesium transporter